MAREIEALEFPRTTLVPIEPFASVHIKKEQV